MKTYLLMDMAYAINEGRLWLGRFITDQCGVLYIDGEMGPGRLGQQGTLNLPTRASPTQIYISSRTWASSSTTSLIMKPSESGSESIRK